MAFAKHLAILLAAATLSCGKSPAEDNLPPTGSGRPVPTALVGSWRGMLTQSAGTSSDLNADFGKDVSIALSDRGVFALAYTDNEAAKATGTFEDFLGQSLLLTIAESTISPLFQKGRTVRLDYKIEGDQLELKSSTTEFTLLRSKEDASKPGTNASSDDGSTGPKTLFQGNWNCTDTGQNKWNVMINGQRFESRIRSRQGGSLLIRGGIEETKENPKIAHARILESNDTRVVGQRLRFTQMTDALTMVSVLSQEPANPDAVVKSFNCTKQG